jgi:hypothetical protein
MRAVGPFVRGAVSTFAVLGGGFLVVVGVAFIGGGSDPFFGNAYGLDIVCLLYGLLLVSLGIAGWRRLWRMRDLPPEPAREKD